MLQNLNQLNEKQIQSLQLLTSFLAHADSCNKSLEQGCPEIINHAVHNLAPSTVLSFRLTIKKLYSHFSPSRIINSIDQKAAEEFIYAVKKTMPLGYAVMFRNCRAMWNRFLAWNYVSSNPFSKIKLPKVQRLKPGYPLDDELALILQQRIWNNKKTVKDIIISLSYTGCRAGELIFLKWHSVDFEKKLLIIGSDSFKTKTRKQRLVPMPDALYELLLKRIKQKISINGEIKNSMLKNIKDNYVFGGKRGRSFTVNYVSKTFKKACHHAGVSNSIHLHSLRHRYATVLLEKGAPVHTVQALLGHSSVTTTMVYVTNNLAALHEAAMKIEA